MSVEAAVAAARRPRVNDARLFLAWPVTACLLLAELRYCPFIVFSMPGQLDAAAPLSALAGALLLLVGTVAMILFHADLVLRKYPKAIARKLGLVHVEPEPDVVSSRSRWPRLRAAVLVSFSAPRIAAVLDALPPVDP